MKKEFELYEVLYLIKPNFTEQQLGEKIEFYRDFLTARGSQVMVQNRGKRSLSYEIKGHETANYVQMLYVGNKDLLTNLNINLGRDESILRHFTTKVNDASKVAY